jgi:hypothetical protein
MVSSGMLGCVVLTRATRRKIPEDTIFQYWNCFLAADDVGNDCEVRPARKPNPVRHCEAQIHASVRR